MQSSLAGGDGESGSSNKLMCKPGHTGPFCAPCPVGSFKYGFGYSVCQQCFNKPENAFYTSLAQGSANCDYECNSGYEQSAYNPKCLDSLTLSIKRFGDLKGGLTILGCFLAFTLFIWLILVINSRYISEN
jgi:hypothetical protein